MWNPRNSSSKVISLIWFYTTYVTCVSIVLLSFLFLVTTMKPFWLVWMPFLINKYGLLNVFIVPFISFFKLFLGPSFLKAYLCKFLIVTTPSFPPKSSECLVQTIWVKNALHFLSRCTKYAQKWSNTNFYFNDKVSWILGSWEVCSTPPTHPSPSQ